MAKLDVHVCEGPLAAHAEVYASQGWQRQTDELGAAGQRMAVVAAAGEAVAGTAVAVAPAAQGLEAGVAGQGEGCGGLNAWPGAPAELPARLLQPVPPQLLWRTQAWQAVQAS